MTPIPVCPLCGNEARWLFAVDGYGICECHRCEHRFAEPARVPAGVHTTHDVDSAGNGSGAPWDLVAEGPLLRKRGRRYAERLHPLLHRGELLAAGAAAGFALQGFIDAGWQGSGVEPNEHLAAYARDVLQLDVRTGMLEDYPRDRQFDLVTLLQVLDGVADLRRTLDTVASLTRSGGHCLIETWDYASHTARMMGKRWPEYRVPGVSHWFSRPGLVRLLEPYGFNPVSEGMTVKWLSCGHARWLLEQTLGRSAIGRTIAGFMKALPERTVVPYPGDDLFWALFRKDDAEPGAHAP